MQDIQMEIIRKSVRTNNNDGDDDGETTLSLSVIFVMGQSMNDAKCKNIKRSHLPPPPHPNHNQYLKLKSKSVDPYIM